MAAAPTGAPCPTAALKYANAGLETTEIDPLPALEARVSAGSF